MLKDETTYFEKPEPENDGLLASWIDLMTSGKLPLAQPSNTMRFDVQLINFRGLDSHCDPNDWANEIRDAIIDKVESLARRSIGSYHGPEPRIDDMTPKSAFLHREHVSFDFS